MTLEDALEDALRTKDARGLRRTKNGHGKTFQKLSYSPGER